VAGSTYPLPQDRLPKPEITLHVGKNLLPRLPHFETSRDHSFDRRLDRTSRDLARQNGNLCCGLLGPLFLARFAEELGDGVHDEKVGLVVHRPPCPLVDETTHCLKRLEFMNLFLLN
jgi:hypothetical protein